MDGPATASVEGTEQQAPWRTTRAGRRIAELDEVQENIAALLHFAGCTLASLHPRPLAHFTSRELATNDSEGYGDDEGDSGDKPTPEGDEAKLADFAKYAEGYYATLNDIQLGLRTSIRHLRVARTSPAPLVDPAFASLVASTAAVGATVGPGGLAARSLLAPLRGGLPRWKADTERLPVRNVEGEPVAGEGKLSLAALELERDAWADLVHALEKARSADGSE